ncbi:MAG: hypothetical protein GY749_33240 [Desulfobacteraceae bacterium]|nr:hypothetical protein [Desulfobacteraceae bacterium]
MSVTKTVYLVPTLCVGMQKTVYLVPTLCVGMQTGRSASGSVRRKTVSGSRKQDAERPGCIPTRSMGTRRTRKREILNKFLTKRGCIQWKKNCTTRFSTGEI